MNSPAPTSPPAPSAPRKLCTFDELWDRDFVPLVSEKRRIEAERRTDAMIDVPITLCGELVRQMTAHDMVILDAMDNGFIAGASDGLQFVDLVGFVWQLHSRNNQTSSFANLWRRSRVIKRLSARDHKQDAADIMAFVDMMMMESGGSPARETAESSDALRPEPKTHFLVPLIVKVATEFGHVDPLNGELLAHVPLPRLIQYSRGIDADKGGPHVYTEIDSLRNRCVDRVNQVNWARRHGLPDPVFPALTA